MKLKAILFDLDGTLLDTLGDLTDAGNAALKSQDLPPLAAARYRRFIGFGLKNLAAEVMREAAGQKPGLDQIERYTNDFFRFYQKLWHGQTKPYAGVMPLLTRLRQEAVPLAILSNKDDAFTQKIVAHYFPKHPFAFVCGRKEGVPAKPDPSVALDLCARMGARPQETALVGDSESDMQTATAAGMRAIGVTWGFRDAAEIKAGGADVLVRDIKTLQSLLLEE